jgi:DNA-binding SARP family transcriptional activator/tetratricopeptide (TPR) repeat protein
MLRLKTLGGLCVERSPPPSLSTCPRRRLLAVIALIAGHDDRGISRDKLLAYLWPESDTSRARSSLKQALSSLRQSLGAPLIDSAGGVLRLNPHLIKVDLWEFEAALARGDYRAAALTYGGPFLDGFSVSGLEELTKWVEVERERLARGYNAALRVLAGEAEALGDRHGAIGWYQRLIDAEPLCSAAAVGLVRALASAGDFTAAKAHARAYSARLVGVGVPVDHAVGEFVRELRDQPAKPESAPMKRGDHSPATPIVRGPDRRSGSAAVIDLPPPPSLPAVPRFAWWGVAVVWALALLSSAFGPAGVLRAIDRPKGTEPTTVAVAPFSVADGPESAKLGRRLEALLAVRLDGADGLRTVPYGTGLGAARLYLRGHLTVVSGRIRAKITLFDRANANLAMSRADAEVESTALVGLADALASQVIAERSRGASRLIKVAARSTRSFPALKAYIRGERLFKADSCPAAADAFRAAVAADTTFALAYYRLSIAAESSGPLALAANERAMRFSDRLSDHDRRLIEANLVRGRGRIDEAERLYREIVADFPHDGEAWFQLGQVLFRSNSLHGRSAAEARPFLERAVELEPDNRVAMVQLARIAALTGDDR